MASYGLFTLRILVFILKILPKTVVSLRAFACFKASNECTKKIDFRLILLKCIETLKTVSYKTLGSQ